MWCEYPVITVYTSVYTSLNHSKSTLIHFQSIWAYFLVCFLVSYEIFALLNRYFPHNIQTNIVRACPLKKKNNHVVRPARNYYFYSIHRQEAALFIMSILTLQEQRALQGEDLL